MQKLGNWGGGGGFKYVGARDRALKLYRGMWHRRSLLQPFGTYICDSGP